MDIITVHQTHEKLDGKAVTIEGWVRNHRAQKTFGFLDVSDGTHFRGVQVVYDEGRVENYKETQKIRIGSSVRIHGILTLTPKMKQPYEIKADTIELVGDSPEDYPIQPKRHSREFLREHAHLRTRTNLFTALNRVRNVLTLAVHDFFQSRNFIHVASPIITAIDAEGAGELFKVTTLDLANVPKKKDGTVDFTRDFFGKATNLAVTGQLEAEIFAQAYKKAYTFGPTFRAEKSNTTTHASEFWMIEPEFAFANLSDNMELSEAMVKHLIRAVREEAPEEMEFFDRFVEKGLLKKLDSVLDKSFHRISHRDAIDILMKADTPFENKPTHGGDLATEHEKYLVNHFDGPVFVTDWPKDAKAFYMRLNDDRETVAAMDLLVPGAGEIIGGSQREERLDVLRERMAEMGIEETGMWWYLDLRKYGTTPHAGFGLGFDRMLMYVTGVANIRDVIPFPRTPRHCDF